MVEKSESTVVREGNVIVTGVVDALPISVEDEDVTNAVLEEIHNTAVTSDIGDPKTFSKVLSTRRGEIGRAHV